MRKLILFLTAIVGITQLNAQSDKFDALYSDIKNFRSMSISQKLSAEEKSKMNDSLRTSIRQYLSLENSFQHPIDSVPYLADLYSPDKSFRIITWNIGNKDLTNEYYAFIQKEMKDKSVVWFELIDLSAKQFRTIDYKTFSYKNWFGALYYDIIPFKHKGNPHYLLLGWDGNDKISNKKIVEVLHFDRKGQPKFGAPVFKSSGRSKKRIVMQYTKDASVSLRYHPKRKMVIYDHLEPMKPELEGLYEFYAPDLSYDGLKLRGGVWEVKEAIDVLGKKTEKYNDPREIKDPTKTE